MRKYSHAMIICSLMAIMSLSLAGSQVSAAPLSAGPVGTAFTYQGQLKDGSGNPITNTCDFQFSLYDALASGNQIGTTQPVPGVSVANGYFTSSLDFGPGRFGGDARWLEIAVRCPAGGGGYTTLTPRQPLTPAPYSLYALNAGLLNNLPSTSFQQHYQNLVVVAQSGGDYTTITQALNSITTAGAGNPFLIYVAPGTYTETVTMKPYVDIEGSGELTTKITQTGSASQTTSTVVGASNAELRFLTVENTGSNAYATAIYNAGASPRLTHITATASGATDNTGVFNNFSSPAMTNVTAPASGGVDSWGVYNYNSSSPTMTNVIASASGAATSDYGVYNTQSSPTMTNVTATASGGTNSYGLYNTSSSPTMTNVTAFASGAATGTYGVDNESSSSPTMMNVTASASGAATNNYGVDNESSSSPTMMNVTATASGGTNNYGVHNSYSMPLMTNVVASGTGGGDSYGVFNEQSSPTMTNVTATASGGMDNYGVYNRDWSAPVIQSSVIAASGGTTYGIYDLSFGGPICTVQVNNSRITGAIAIAVSGNWYIYVGASQLSGVALGPGFHCVSSYNAAYLPLNPTCTYP